LLGGATPTTEYYEMHRDNIGFAVRTASVGGVATGLGVPPDCHELPPGAFDLPPQVQPPPFAQARTLFDAAMVATSAIPLVFKVTDVPQNPVVYQWRTAYWDRDRKKAVVDQPLWLCGERANPLDYSATDGGLFDNQPFDIAHQRLAGARGRNPQDGAKACRAVVLIDPLAQDREPVPSNPVKTQIFEVITKLVLTPVLQDRLDTMDLAQIKDETIFSRFMIAPSRENPDNPGVSWSPSKSLLSAPLDAFLGFAAQPYREHDFLLGRRNAQQFLRERFVLPADHPLIRDVVGWHPSDEITRNGVAYRVLVPLRGRAADEQPAPEWKWQALELQDIDRYATLVRSRLNAIFHNLKTRIPGEGGFFGWLLNVVTRIYLNLGWVFGVRGKILDAFKAAMAEARRSLDPTLPDRN